MAISSLWPEAQRVPAEALHRVAEPLTVALRRGAPASAPAIARHFASLISPAVANVETPGWLRPEQREICRRLVHVLAERGGALLAEPVGSGKTYVALAVAQLANGPQTTSVLAPAALLSHWRRIAREVGVPIAARSHTAASRGQLPAGTGMVLIDECHHYRNPATRRYAAVARWLVGRRALLLSATPAINDLEEVAAQLLLAVRDDALAPWGTASLRSALRGNVAPPSVGELIVARPPPADGPQRTTLHPSDDGEPLAQLIDRLSLAPELPVAGLIRRVLLGAAASSPAALAEAAGRYERLLLNARDAALAGRPLGRESLRKFSGEYDEQLLFWELLPTTDEAPLQLDDLDGVRSLRREAQVRAQRDDARSLALKELLADGTPTLVFCTRRATVRWLRARLADPRVAWCMGDRAGIGPLPLSRAAVLEQFRSSSALGRGAAWAPRHLIATDLAAEGLDLRRLVRVVHYDVPWTAAKLAQREGRVVNGDRLQPPLILAAADSVEARLQRSRVIDRKASLPQALGLSPDSRWWWTWRERLARDQGEGASTAGCAVVAGERSGVLAGLVMTARHGRSVTTRATTLVWSDTNGAEDDPRVVVPILEAVIQRPARAATPEEWRLAAATVAPVARARLALGQRAALAEASHDAARATLLERLHRMVRVRARQRDREGLGALERALLVVGRGHTAGETMRLRELQDRSDAELLGTLARWEAEPPALLDVSLSGVIIVQEPAGSQVDRGA